MNNLVPVCCRIYCHRPALTIRYVVDALSPTPNEVRPRRLCRLHWHDLEESFATTDEALASLVTQTLCPSNSD